MATENFALKANLDVDDFYASRATMSLADVEKEHIMLVLNSVSWHKKKAYTILGISKPTLNKKIKDYGLVKPVQPQLHVR